MDTIDVIPDRDSERDSDSGLAEFAALKSVVEALKSLNPEARRRIIDSAITFLKVGTVGRLADWSVAGSETRPRPYPAFSEGEEKQPKDFLFEKQPRTDVERIACLAYYLTHYRAVKSFKTLELSKLNTEAAQPKFSNAANATNNAVKMGYLVPSSKGQKQLSAAGEQFVRALPDREGARAAMTSVLPRRRPRKASRSAGAEANS